MRRGRYLGLALAHVLLFEAPLEALVTGLDDPRGAALALGAVALAALRGVHLLTRAAAPDDGRQAAIAARACMTLAAIAAVAPLYLASAMLVTPFSPATARRSRARSTSACASSARCCSAGCGRSSDSRRS